MVCSAGCPELLKQIRRVKPSIHVFGHIHEAHGVTRSEDTVFINASSVTYRYKPSYSAVVVDFERVAVP